MDNLIIKRIWQDSDFFEIEVIAESDYVCAKTNSYSNDESIKELAERLSIFPRFEKDDYLWENGEKGDGYTPFVSLRFFCKDKLGHIGIEVYMEIDDGGSCDKHHCCFFISTEIGLLNRFGKSLLRLNEPIIGIKAELNSDW